MLSLLTICISSLERCLFRSAHFSIRFLVFLLLSCLSSLYILKIKSLMVLWFANIFSHSVGCLLKFFFFKFSFAVQKLASLIRSHSYMFGLIYVALEDLPQKMLIWFMSENVLPMSFSRSFMFVNVCFMYLGIPVLGAFMLTSIKSSSCFFSSYGIFLYGLCFKVCFL